MMKKIGKIVEAVLSVILIVIIIILGYYIIQKMNNKDKPIKVFGVYLYEVDSWSMYKPGDKDSLAVGDLIIVKERKKQDYQAGMVVTYDTGDSKPTTHKIIGVDGNSITTQGISDSNTSPDKAFDKSLIIGEVTGVWHNYRKFVSFLTSPIGIILIIVGIFILFETPLIVGKIINKQKNKKLIEEIEKEKNPDPEL